jgi:hypothetical protein
MDLHGTMVVEHVIRQIIASIARMGFMEMAVNV